MRTKLTVIGASGRSGSLVIAKALESPDWSITGAVVSTATMKQGAPKIFQPVPFTDAIEESVALSDIVIDFSAPEASVRAASVCARIQKPILIATTGHSDTELALIHEASKSTAVLLAPNTSLSVFVLHELSLLAASLLGDSFDIEIMELHHKKKRDAPSGTALSLAHTIEQRYARSLTSPRNGRDSLRKENELSVVSLRGGDSPGEHSIFFLGEGERIEITQRVRDRSVFAQGALLLAKKLIDRAPGLYTVKDLLRAPH